MGITTMENSMKVPPKIRKELPYDPAIPLLDIYPKTIYVPLKLPEAFFTTAHDIETTYMPIRLPRWHEWERTHLPLQETQRCRFSPWAGTIPMKGTATHSRILAWRIPWTEGAWWAVVHGIAKESDMT